MSGRRVGVVLSSYERPAGLARAIKSLRDQSFRDWVCCICDDHSKAPEVHGILATATKDPRIFVMSGHQEYTPKQKLRICSFSKLINGALDWMDDVGVDFVSYLLDDVGYHRQRLEKHVRFLERRPKIDLVWGEQWLVEHDEKGNVVRERKQVPHARDNHEGMTMQAITNRLSRHNIINHCSATHRRSSHRWSEDAKHWASIDWQFWRLLARDGAQFAHIPVVGETMHSGPDDIGPMMNLRGKTIEDVAKRRAMKRLN